MITFLASGLWHGANITFVLWGGLHGIYQVAEEIAAPIAARLYQKFHIDTRTFSWKLMSTVKTFLLVDIAWVFFRADTVQAALEILRRSLMWSNTGLILNGGLYQMGLDQRNMMFLLIALAALFAVSVMRERGIHVLAWLSKQNVVFRYAVYWSGLVLIIFSMDIMGQEFIYFQF